MRLYIHRANVLLRIAFIVLSLVAAQMVGNIACGQEIQIVAPAGLEDTEGDAFGASMTNVGFRVQSLHLASEFSSLPPGATIITDIAARMDEQQESSVVRNFPDISITLATTTADSLSENFQANLDNAEEVKEVFSGDDVVTFEGTGDPDGPRPFYTSTATLKPFRYDPTEGRNLIVEWLSVAGADTDVFVDWEIVDPPNPSASVFSFDAGSELGALVDSVEVHQFTFIPEPSAFGLLLVGSLLAALRRNWLTLSRL